MSKEEDYDFEQTITYYYDTESYDFNPYDSTDEHHAKLGIYRDFEYNKSIGSSSHLDENESIEMRNARFNIGTFCGGEGHHHH